MLVMPLDYIRSQFKGLYHHYDAMTEEDKLKWSTDFKVILIFNYNFIQINQNCKTEIEYFLMFLQSRVTWASRVNDRLKRSTSPKS